MHGELLTVRCERCGHKSETRVDVGVGTQCEECGTAALRPDIVWFGEMPQHMEQIENALQSCDLFAAIGTRGNVFPAASFGAEAARAGAHTIEVNLEPSAVNSAFAETRLGPASEVVPTWVDELLAAESLDHA